MNLKIFLSTVSDELEIYRERLRGDLTRHDAEVKVQEDFENRCGRPDACIAHCDAASHLGGGMTGSAPGAGERALQLKKYPFGRSKCAACAARRRRPWR